MRRLRGLIDRSCRSCRRVAVSLVYATVDEGLKEPVVPHTIGTRPRGETGDVTREHLLGPLPVRRPPGPWVVRCLDIDVARCSFGQVTRSRQQFNVNLDPGLVRRVKHHAIDVQQSVSELVGHVLERHLGQETAMPDDPSLTDTSSVPDGAGTGEGLFLQPMVHVEHMGAAVGFYEALGATVLHGSRDGDFVMLRIGGAQLGLLAHPPNPEQHEGLVELNFETSGSLEGLEQRLRESGVDVTQSATDEAFGAQLQVAAPDGLLVKINQLDPGLYT